MKKICSSMPTFTLLLFSSLSFAQAPLSESTAVDNEVPLGSARSAYIDPETGELTSTPDVDSVADLQAQSRSVNIDGASTMEQMANGMIKVNFNGEFNKTVNVSIDADGNMNIGHDVDIHEHETE